MAWKMTGDLGAVRPHEDFRHCQ